MTGMPASVILRTALAERRHALQLDRVGARLDEPGGVGHGGWIW